jgi:hypothetical protein
MCVSSYSVSKKFQRYGSSPSASARKEIKITIARQMTMIDMIKVAY